MAQAREEEAWVTAPVAWVADLVAGEAPAGIRIDLQINMFPLLR